MGGKGRHYNRQSTSIPFRVGTLTLRFKHALDPTDTKHHSTERRYAITRKLDRPASRHWGFELSLHGLCVEGMTVSTQPLGEYMGFNAWRDINSDTRRLKQS